MNESKFVSYTQSASVSDAINTRRSIRRFLPTVVADSVLADILDTAARAPSGTNMQPWQVYVVTGESRDRLCQRVCKAFDEERGTHDSEEPYYPREWFEP